MQRITPQELIIIIIIIYRGFIDNDMEEEVPARRKRKKERKETIFLMIPRVKVQGPPEVVETAILRKKMMMKMS